MALKFQAPTGMCDVFGEDVLFFEKVEKAVRKMAGFYHFKQIITPIVEQTEIFEKGTGISSDIVEKQMYTFKTKGGDALALRPEVTPGVVRAYIEHGMQAMPKPVNLWYWGPVFRYERPQAGRYRQFNQAGFESFGTASAVVDAQMIQIFYKILKETGLKNLMVEINSIGDSQCRPYYKKSLVSYLRSHQASLCADCKRRLKQNPLRALDCKDEKCLRVKKGAPQTIDHLCKDCHSHFKSILEFLDEQEIPYSLNPYLVRGLDYYTRTVFEIFEDTSEGREQGALAGGGRYDDLVKLLGGKETSACGGACGIERIANVLKKKGIKPREEEGLEVFVAQIGDLAKKKGLKLLEDFREAKVKVGEAIYKDSLSSQMKMAERMQSKYVLILGQKEALENEVILRDMKTGDQKLIPFDKAVAEVKKKIK